MGTNSFGFGDNEPPQNSVHPANRAEWRAWLKAHHRRTEGIWVVTNKVASGLPRLDYDDIVEEALCFGWIDSKPAKLDALRSMRWCAPRKAGTGWSRRNKEKIRQLIASRRMTKSGLEKIEAAKRDGSWQSLDKVEALTIPPDLAQALSGQPGSRERFAAFPRSVKRSILEWIDSAKRPETRSKRVEETARLAAQGVRANQWRQTTQTGS